MSDGIAMQAGMRYGPYGIKAGLEAWWEDANETDKHKNVSMGATPGPSIPGPNGISAWDADGTNCVSGLNNISGLTPDTEHSAMFVIQRTADLTYFIIQGQGSSLFYLQTRNFNRLEARNYGSPVITTTSFDNDGLWHTIGYTVDASSVMTVYIDDVVIGSQPMGAGTGTGWQDFLTGPTHKYAVAAIWSRGLSPEEVTYFHNSGNFLTYADL